MSNLYNYNKFKKIELILMESALFIGCSKNILDNIFLEHN